jgi:hypothetical protein
MAVCCQNLTLGAHSSCSALSLLVGALFKTLSFFEHALYFQQVEAGQNYCPAVCF